MILYRYRLIATAIVGLLMLAALCAFVGAAMASGQPQSCSTPAANWATLVACRTETAAALRTPTRTATAVPPTPTRIVPTVTVIPSPTSRSVWICADDFSHCSEFRMPYHVYDFLPTRTVTP